MTACRANARPAFRCRALRDGSRPSRPNARRSSRVNAEPLFSSGSRNRSRPDNAHLSCVAVGVVLASVHLLLFPNAKPADQVRAGCSTPERRPSSRRYSSGWCAWLIEPGPSITTSMPSCAQERSLRAVDDAAGFRSGQPLRPLTHEVRRPAGVSSGSMPFEQRSRTSRLQRRSRSSASATRSRQRCCACPATVIAGQHAQVHVEFARAADPVRVVAAGDASRDSVSKPVPGTTRRSAFRILHVRRARRAARG